MWLVRFPSLLRSSSFCSKEIDYETFDDESSSSERLVDLGYVSGGTSHPHRRVRPSTTPLDEEHVSVTQDEVFRRCRDMLKERNELANKVECTAEEKEDLTAIMAEFAKVIAELQARLRES